MAKFNLLKNRKAGNQRRSFINMDNLSTMAQIGGGYLALKTANVAANEAGEKLGEMMPYIIVGFIGVALLIA